MNQEFYRKYGENVAMVSEQIVKMACNQANDLVERFSNQYLVKDKHGKTYGTRIAFRNSAESSSNSQAVLIQLFGKHRHGS